MKRNLELPPMVKDYSRETRGLHNWSAIRKRYQLTGASVPKAKTNAEWIRMDLVKRKTPLPMVGEGDKKHLKFPHWQVLQQPDVHLWQPSVQRAIASAIDCEDEEFFIVLGRKFDNPPVTDSNAEYRQFLFRHWLVLEPSRVELVEDGKPGKPFECGIIPKGNPDAGQPCMVRQVPARPKKELPGLCFFTTEAIEEFHAALPHAKRKDQKFWQNQIDRLELRRPRLLLVRPDRHLRHLTAINREGNSIKITYTFPKGGNVAETFPLFPEDFDRVNPAWKSSRSNRAG